MSVASPPWLFAALALAVGALVFWRMADRRRRAALERFAALQLLPDLTAELSPRRRSVKRALLLAAILLAGLALAGPQYGFTWEETQRRGIDVLIALDTSRSMLAQDVAPNRIERAKLAIIDLVDKLGGDRVGLIAFAGSAFLQFPLTLDHGAFLESLQALEPGIIPTPGSDLASALQTASEALRSEARNVKLLVLFSDGEDLGGGALAAARAAAEQGLRVFTVGIGSDAGELIPVPGAKGGTEFLKDPQGQFVKSKLDAATLRQVAELTGGFYEPLGRRGEAVDAIYDRALAPLPKEELASRMRRVPIDRFQWPLALALLCLAAEPVLRERRGRGARTTALLLAALLSSAGSARAASPQEAARLYSAGEYDKALAEYRAAAGAANDNPKLDFNLGAAAYKSGAFGDAAGAFEHALRSDDPKLQAEGFYNLGNTQFRIGQQSEQKNPQQTMQAWQQAIDAYQAALKVAPTDEDARFNRDFVKHALEELQKQQQQQKNDQDKQDKKDNKDQQKKDDQQQQQQGDQQQKPGDDQKQQQQQPPDQQQAKGDQPKDQGGKPDEQKKDQDQQANAKPDESKQDKQQPQKGDGNPEPRNEQPQDGNEQTARAQQAQGQMSPAEAKELLDSMQDGDATLQQLEASKAPHPRKRDSERDW